MKARTLLWLIPVIGMAILTPFTPTLDLSIAGYFYSKGADAVEHFMTTPFFDFMFAYGVLPAWIVTVPAMFALLLSYVFKKCRLWRPHAMFLVLVLAVGSGFLINTVLKDYWGRPRPKQVVEFGGQHPFRPFYKPNFSKQPEPLRSFPCGHCSMGFFFFTFILMGIRFNKRWLFHLGWIITLVLGGALGITRMAQGGHFFSDVLMSALIMWLIALAFDWLVYEELA